MRFNYSKLRGLIKEKFETQEKFAKAMGMESEMGFWLIDLYTDSKGNINRINPELYNFEEKKILKRKR